MTSRLKLEVVTPQRILLETTVDEVIVPAQDGLRGLLPDHEPFVTNLRLGPLSYRQGNESRSLVVGEGILEVRENMVSALVETAKTPEEIDILAFEQAKRSAATRLQSGDDTLDFQQTQRELEAAEIYLGIGTER